MNGRGPVPVLDIIQPLFRSVRFSGVQYSSGYSNLSGSERVAKGVLQS